MSVMSEVVTELPGFAHNMLGRNDAERAESNYHNHRASTSFRAAQPSKSTSATTSVSATASFSTPSQSSHSIGQLHAQAPTTRPSSQNVEECHPNVTERNGVALHYAPTNAQESAATACNDEPINCDPESPILKPTYHSSRSLSSAASPSRIVVKDLSQIQAFASEELLARMRSRERRASKGFLESGQQYEISSMPVEDIIEMVAGLLTKITTTNDEQHQHLHRHIPPVEATSSVSQLTSSVLAFHGKNIPSISISSYLNRIHKYCPTTYEVFLSLLVYFDRMTERVNSGKLRITHEDDPVEEAQEYRRQSVASSHAGSQPGFGVPESSADKPSSMSMHADATTNAENGTQQSQSTSTPRTNSQQHAQDLSDFFVVDSYNIHRLIIAGVTCASKFFSDVFYTNSRYAKVGGLPLVELNHLELQFLLLNDFRLSIPVEELEAYGTMLVEFYGREVMAKQEASLASTPDSEVTFTHQKW